MSAWWRTRCYWLLAYGAIATLVVGGLGWVTAETLRLEHSDRTRLALWRLDSRVAPVLAREDSRPYQHYDPLYVPLPALARNGMTCEPGTVLIPSPLLNAELPEWMTLHFQTTPEGRWLSPQVLSAALAAKLRAPANRLDLGNVTPPHAERLAALAKYPPKSLFDRLPAESTVAEPERQQAQQQVDVPQQQAANQSYNPSYDNDLGSRSRVANATKGEGRGGFTTNTLNFALNDFGEEIAWMEMGGKWAPARRRTSAVRLGLLQPLWLNADGQPEQLVVARLAVDGGCRIVQGILLDWPKLRDLLLAEVRDLFPNADLVPAVADVPEQAMTALPVRLVPGASPPGWSPLRVGLSLAWLAAALALAVVGLGGWGLLDLSERRFRFVSAVTHELRTPLTTLRLYLDMLTSGLVRDEPTKAEYLQTLHGESDRLHRLVTNVLDFARLERQRPRLSRDAVDVAELLDKLRDDWRERCKSADKELIVDAPALTLTTDRELVERIVGNLIDNACKYSRGSADARIWLRAVRDGNGVTLEVEDRGPGVTARERRGIFRPFRRGKDADTTAGGVGLGLALADRWARMLGGRLTVSVGQGGVGACFRLTLTARD